MDSKRIKALYAVVAAALLSAIAMPLAFAGAADGPTASASGAKATKQIKALNKRIAALERRGGSPATPVGPAAGDLTGNYPAPQIRENAVTSPEVAADTLTVDDIATGGVGTLEIGDGSVEAADLRGDSVGASELKAVTTAVSAPGTGIANGASGIAQVTCPGDTMLIAGGHAWTEDEAGTSIIASAPSEANPNKTWVVQGRTSTSSNTLFAWATCLAV